jgi:hypothetical protein
MSKQIAIVEDDQWFIGEYKELAFDITDCTVTPNVPKNMTGLDLKFTLGLAHKPDTKLLTKLKPSSVDIILSDKNGTNDRISVLIQPADYSVLPHSVYYLELWQMSGAGSPALLSFGLVTIRQS